LPTDSVFGTLSALAAYLGGTVRQTAVVFLSAFFLYPSWATVPIALYRGVCMGLALFAVSSGCVVSTGFPELPVLLYFPSTVLLLLGASLAHSCRRTLSSSGSPVPACDKQALLFSYLRSFLVLSGAVFAVSGFAIIFC